ncbi:MAG: Gfo/Idh/MocA family protein [Armatimonadota bacterium]
MSSAKVVRLGVIGTGGMGQGHLASMKDIDEVQLTALCDIDPAVAERLGNEYGVPYFLKHEDLLASGLCDAVIIATPHPFHAPIAIDAFRAGLHVLSEKPISEKVSAGDAMIAAAKESGKTFAVMFQLRTYPAMMKAMEIVRSGQLGRIFRTTMISPEYRSQAYYDSGTWRATWTGEGGGIMMNQAPHITDMFIKLAGMPSEVYGRTETRIHNIEVEDLAEAMLKYPDGGSGFYYCSTNESGPGQMIEVFGDKGKLVYRNGELKFYRFTPSVTEFTRVNTEMWAGPKCDEVELELADAQPGHTVITRNFARNILYGEPLVSPGEEGIRSLELANAIWLSAHLNQPVKLPLDRKAYDEFLEMKRSTSTFVKTTAEVKRATDPRLAK